ncbi:QueT transporter family protein [Vagococcus sp. JNUCC 83]
MENKREHTAVSWTTKDTAKMAIVAGLYVAVTLVLSVTSFGAIQLRLSEMFNYLSLYNKRYIVAVTLGVAIANAFSPLGIIDVLVGSISTFLVLVINYALTKRIKNMKVKMVITAISFAISMFTVAGQLTILYDLPFFYNWLIIGLGELFSMTVGGIIIYWMSKKIDFIK